MGFKKNTKKGQTFSTDIIVVVVIVLFGALFLVIDQISSAESGPSLEEKYELASTDANLIVTDMKESDIITKENHIDVDKLILMDESEIKEELGIRNKFCIVFEKDGKLVKIDPDQNILGIGSEDIMVNGEKCKQN